MPQDIQADSGVVLTLDSDPAHDPWPPGVSPSGDDHALLGIVRQASCRADALLVVRPAQPFGEGERAWLKLVLRHVATALEMAEQLSRPLPTAASAVHLTRLFPMPCLLTDDEGRCVERNHAFDNMLEALRGSVRAGRVAFDERPLQQAWRQALLAGRGAAATHSHAVTTAAGERWTVHVVPFYCVSTVVHGSPRHLMFALFERCGSADTHHPLPTSRPLTQAEMEVLASMLLGHTAKLIARMRGASVNTVRNQIASILAKTGHRTQKELMASFSVSAHGNVMQHEATARH